ncbi:unnamed protein product [Auanema sp. JU1783]|nr:unnamed protein product [Auanema sp. JU1783]
MCSLWFYLLIIFLFFRSSKLENLEDWKNVGPLEQRVSKICHSLNLLKKNLIGSIRTGYKDENHDKRRKKTESYNLAVEMKECSTEIQKLSSTCLHNVLNQTSASLVSLAEERVKYEEMLELHVIDELNKFAEIEKLLARSKEKLAKALTDCEIARKTGEDVDAVHQKLEYQMDVTSTQIYNFAAREQDISKVFAILLEEKREYHRAALRIIESSLPLVLRDIDKARPRPMFGVDLSEHVQHSRKPIAIPIEECCTFLRRTALREKGLFRISGNSVKIKKLKASFDAGHYEYDIQSLENDPHSLCGVLKLYLRELPGSLLVNRLFDSWVEALQLDGEGRINAFRNVLKNLPVENFNNLCYLIDFLTDVMSFQLDTSMNATNLAIVFGPNLLVGDNEENRTVNKIVEILLLESDQLFGIPKKEIHQPSSQIFDNMRLSQSSEAGSLSQSPMRTESVKSVQAPKLPMQPPSSTRVESLLQKRESDPRSSRKYVSRIDVDSSTSSDQNVSLTSFKKPDRPPLPNAVTALNRMNLRDVQSKIDENQND